MIMALCAAETGAFAANARSTRGGGTANTSSAASAPKANSYRSATTQKAVQKPASNSAVTKPGVGKAARAAATQKAIKVGTKVAVATENTAISTECQNAYYGCMDAFCMMDNASGGRCQCNDRITELDTVLAEIMKLEDEILRIESEGVEKVEMGEYADQVAARTKSITDEFSGSGEGNVVSLSGENVKQVKKSRVLDLSSIKTSSMFDDDDEDIFAGLENKEAEIKIADDMGNKKGDELHKSAAKICTQQIPEQCKASAALLQQTYAQRIRSDCTGYANALTQSKQETSRKLMAAKQKVREAVLDAVKEQNKYATQGECVAAFDKCMQTTAGCGADYLQCIADDTVLTMGTDGSKGAATRADVQTSASAIGISANTLAMLTDRAPMCESVLKQCQNVRSGVWNAYLKMIVPTLKVAEVNAEENRRMDCIGNIVNCYTKACAAKWPDQESAEYDMCLSNPDIVGNLCQTQINRCSTGDTGEQVMEYVKAKLQALRVDACTNEVKQCLQSENNCGEGYVNCIGLDKDTIVKMCTNSATNFKLMACQSKFNNNQYEVQNYVAQVAQGIVLNMDNAALKACQEAGKKAMTTFCGSDSKCESEKAKSAMTFINADSLTSQLMYTNCPADAKTGVINYSKCRQNLNSLVYDDLKYNGWQAELVGQLNFGCFDFKDGSIDVNAESVIDIAQFSTEIDEADRKKMEATKQKEQRLREAQAQPEFLVRWNSYNCNWGSQGTSKYSEAYRIADILNQKLKSILGKIETDTTVQHCVIGRDLKGITTYVDSSATDADAGVKAYDEMWTMKSSSGVGKGAFPNLMTQYRLIVADAILQAAEEKYSEEYDAFVAANEAKAQKDLEKRVEEIIKEAKTVEAKNALLETSQAANCANMQYLGADLANNLILNQGWSNEHPRYYDATVGAVKTKSISQLWEKGLIGGARGKSVNNIKTYYEKNNNRCRIVTEVYECSNFHYLSIHKCRGKYEKKETRTDYKQYAKSQKIDNTRHYN